MTRLPVRINKRNRTRGVALPAVVMVMVVMGLLVAGGMTLLMQSQQSHVQQLLAARAMAAARSGIEWGLWQVSDQAGTLGLAGNVTPSCFANTSLTLPAPASDITLNVSCVRTPGAGQVDEGGLKLASYAITAVASFGATTDPLHVRRQMEARHTVCKNPGGAAPAFRC